MRGRLIIELLDPFSKIGLGYNGSSLAVSLEVF
jgi:hypothetical protein